MTYYEKYHYFTVFHFVADHPAVKVLLPPILHRLQTSLQDTPQVCGAHEVPRAQAEGGGGSFLRACI